MVIVFSATKGMSGLEMELAHSRGLFDYDDRISKYWPEFAQQDKDKITVRQLDTRQGCLPSMRLEKGASFQISTGWQWSWQGRNRNMSWEQKPEKRHDTLVLQSQVISS